MQLTIHHCNQEAHRLWLQKVEKAKDVKGFDLLVNERSTRAKFNLILAALDEKNIAVSINTVRPSIFSYKYKYEVIVNFNIERKYSSRNSAKLHIFRLYVKHCPCQTNLKQLISSSSST